MDEAATAPGLRTAVDFYTRKADRLPQRRPDLEDELASVQAELDTMCTTRDQLAGALDEILSQASGPGQEQGASAGEAAESPADEDGNPSAPATAWPESADGTTRAREAACFGCEEDGVESEVRLGNAGHRVVAGDVRRADARHEDD